MGHEETKQWKRNWCTKEESAQKIRAVVQLGGGNFPIIA